MDAWNTHVFRGLFTNKLWATGSNLRHSFVSAGYILKRCGILMEPAALTPVVAESEVKIRR